LKGAKHINDGKGSNEVFLESGDGAFGGIGSMVVWGTNWMLIDLAWMYFLTVEEHSLSITFSARW
jgi:hypothetical protein